jgi:uncharacterized protein (DUF1501 family)
MEQNRRAFLRTLGLATTGTMLMGPWQPRILNAQTSTTPRNFVFCYFNGGWDQLMALDPRDPKVFTDSSAVLKSKRIQLGWDMLPKTFDDGVTIPKQLVRPSGSKIAFGPAMQPMAKNYRHCCVVRGVMMDTVAHDIGRRYFTTGEMPAGLSAKGSSWATRIVAEQGEKTQIPNLVLRVETYNDKLPTYATGLKATSTADLINTLKKGPDALSTELRKLLDDYRASANNCDPTSLDEEGLMNMVQLAQKKAKSLVDSNLSQHFNFLSKTDATMKAIASRYRITSTTSGEAQAALAYQALKHGLAQCVSIELARGLDTHVNNWADDQPNILYRGFRALSVLIDDLKKEKHPDPKLASQGKTLLDNTTIVCFSEFARTPLINSKDVRDHFLVSSSLLVGAGVPGNTVSGKTAVTGMSAYQVDPKAGLSVPTGGVYLNPGNILASILEGAGYDRGELRELPLDCLIKK